MQLALDLIALTAAVIAIAYDERYRRIPNHVTYTTTLLGLFLRAAWALVQLGEPHASAAGVLIPGALGSLVLGVVFGALSVVGLLGFGDAKLLVGIGMCVGHPLSLELALCVLLSGGVVALAQALRAGRLRSVVRNIGQARSLVRERVDEPGTGHRHLFGYALAIALGTLWAVLGRRVPWLLPL